MRTSLKSLTVFVVLSVLSTALWAQTPLEAEAIRKYDETYFIKMTYTPTRLNGKMTRIQLCVIKNPNACDGILNVTLNEIEMKALVRHLDEFAAGGSLYNATLLTLLGGAMGATVAANGYNVAQLGPGVAYDVSQMAPSLASRLRYFAFRFPRLGAAPFISGAVLGTAGTGGYLYYQKLQEKELRMKALEVARALEANTISAVSDVRLVQNMISLTLQNGYAPGQIQRDISNPSPR